MDEVSVYNMKNLFQWQFVEDTLKYLRPYFKTILQ